MSRRIKSLLVAAVQLCLVASLGAKFLYDRSTLPRTWARSLPIDPDSPIRGRYVRLQLLVDARGASEASAVRLRVDGGRLLAEPDPQSDGYRPSDLHVRRTRRGDEAWMLLEPVSFFIPEHVADPSRRPQDEQLWVEATIPPKGPPRPIRLGVRKADGPVVPLDLD